MPRPLWTSANVDREKWRLFLWIGLGGVLALAFLGGTRHQETGWIAAWIIAAVSLGWGMLGFFRARRMKHALPFAPGIYVFATDVLIAEEGRCFQHSFDTLKSVRVRPVPGANGTQEAQIEWIFPGETVCLRVPSQPVAQRILGQLQIAQAQLFAAMAAENWEGVQALDPLYETRYGGAWEILCPPVVLQGSRGETGWFGLPVPVAHYGLIAGIVAGAALWLGANFLRNGFAYGIAESADTPAAWRHFLDRPESSYHAGVRSGKLPAASLRAAQTLGSAEALREVARDFPNSPAGSDARTALDRMYAESEGRARSEVAPAALAAMQSLFRWLREHETADVEVRFGESSAAWLGTVDEKIGTLLPDTGRRFEIVPAAESFSASRVRRREDAVVAELQKGFTNFAPAGVINLQKGRPFSSDPMGFDKPALTIQTTVYPLDAFLTDAASQRAYLKLSFNFKVSVVTPGTRPWSFEVPCNAGNFASGPQSQGGSLYDRMADIAYQELHANLAQNFSVRHQPMRTIPLTPVLTSPVFTAIPAATPRRFPDRVSATGFFISPEGYFITARHVTRDAKNLTVMLESGPLPARLIREDPANDLALMKVEYPQPFTALPIRPSGDARLLEKVSTFGFPRIDRQGKGLKATEGTISGLTGAKDDAHVFQISVPLQPGNSGGPLLDTRGNVVGVVVAGFDAAIAQNVNYAVQSNELLKFLGTISELPKNLPTPMKTEPPDLIETIGKATVRLEGDANSRGELRE